MSRQQRRIWHAEMIELAPHRRPISGRSRLPAGGSRWGTVGTKPYCSSGNYINKMSRFCKGCRFQHKKRVGDDACPFTTLNWGCMDRQYDQLKVTHRMNFPIMNLKKCESSRAKLPRFRIVLKNFGSRGVNVCGADRDRFVTSPMPTVRKSAEPNQPEIGEPRRFRGEWTNS